MSEEEKVESSRDEYEYVRRQMNYDTQAPDLGLGEALDALLEEAGIDRVKPTVKDASILSEVDSGRQRRRYLFSSGSSEASEQAAIEKHRELQLLALQTEVDRLKQNSREDVEAEVSELKAEVVGALEALAQREKDEAERKQEHLQVRRNLESKLEACETRLAEEVALRGAAESRSKELESRLRASNTIVETLRIEEARLRADLSAWRESRHQGVSTALDNGEPPPLELYFRAEEDLDDIKRRAAERGRRLREAEDALRALSEERKREANAAAEEVNRLRRELERMAKRYADEKAALAASVAHVDLEEIDSLKRKVNSLQAALNAQAQTKPLALAASKAALKVVNNDSLSLIGCPPELVVATPQDDSPRHEALAAAAAAQAASASEGQRNELRRDYEQRLKDLVRTHESRLADAAGDIKAQCELELQDIHAKHAVELAEANEGCKILDRRFAAAAAEHATILKALREEISIQFREWHERELAELTQSFEVKLQELEKGGEQQSPEALDDESDNLKLRQEGELGKIVEGQEQNLSLEPSQISQTHSDSEMDKLKKQHELALRTVETEMTMKHERELREVWDRHQRELQTIRSQSAVSMADLKRNHELCLTALKDELSTAHQNQVRELKEQHEREMAVVQSESTEIVSELKKTHELSLNAVKDEMSKAHEIQIRELVEQHVQEIAVTRSESTETFSELKKKHELDLSAVKDELSMAHENQIRELMEQHDRQIALVQSQSTESFAELKQKHEACLNAVKDELTMAHKDHVRELVAHHGQEISAVRTQCTQSLEELKKRHELSLQESKEQQTTVHEREDRELVEDQLQRSVLVSSPSTTCIDEKADEKEPPESCLNNLINELPGKENGKVSELVEQHEEVAESMRLENMQSVKLAVEELKAQYERTLTTAKRDLSLKHEGEVSEILERHRHEVGLVRAELRQNFEAKLKEVQESFEPQMSLAKAKLRHELTAHHEEQLRSVVDKHAQQLASMQAQLTSSEAKLIAIKGEHEQSLEDTRNAWRIKSETIATKHRHCIEEHERVLAEAVESTRAEVARQFSSQLEALEAKHSEEVLAANNALSQKLNVQYAATIREILNRHEIELKSSRAQLVQEFEFKLELLRKQQNQIGVARTTDAQPPEKYNGEPRDVAVLQEQENADAIESRSQVMAACDGTVLALKPQHGSFVAGKSASIQASSAKEIESSENMELNREREIVAARGLPDSNLQEEVGELKMRHERELLATNEALSAKLKLEHEAHVQAIAKRHGDELLATKKAAERASAEMVATYEAQVDELKKRLAEIDPKCATSLQPSACDLAADEAETSGMSGVDMAMHHQEEVNKLVRPCLAEHLATKKGVASALKVCTTPELSCTAESTEVPATGRSSEEAGRRADELKLSAKKQQPERELVAKTGELEREVSIQAFVDQRTFLATRVLEERFASATAAVAATRLAEKADEDERRAVLATRLEEARRAADDCAGDAAARACEVEARTVLTARLEAALKAAEARATQAESQAQINAGAVERIEVAIAALAAGLKETETNRSAALVAALQQQPRGNKRLLSDAVSRLSQFVEAAAQASRRSDETRLVEVDVERRARAEADKAVEKCRTALVDAERRMRLVVDDIDFVLATTADKDAKRMLSATRKRLTAIATPPETQCPRCDFWRIKADDASKSRDRAERDRDDAKREFAVALAKRDRVHARSLDELRRKANTWLDQIRREWHRSTKAALDKQRKKIQNRQARVWRTLGDDPRLGTSHEKSPAKRKDDYEVDCTLPNQHLLDVDDLFHHHQAKPRPSSNTPRFSSPERSLSPSCSAEILKATLEDDME